MIFNLNHDDPDLFFDSLIDICENGELDAIGLNWGHTKDRHIQSDTKVNSTINEDIARIIEENVGAAGSYSSPAMAQKCIEFTIGYNAQEITDWMFSKKNEFENYEDYNRLVITKYMGNEPTGVGINDNFEEIESHSAKIVLARDYALPYGFYLVTSYPDFTEEHSVPTGKVYTKDEILKEGLYKFASPIEQAVWETNYECRENGISGIKIDVVRNDHSTDRIRITTNAYGSKYFAFINPKYYNEEFKFIKYTDNVRTKLSQEALKKEVPILADLTNQLVDRMNELIIELENEKKQIETAISLTDRELARIELDANSVIEDDPRDKEFDVGDDDQGELEWEGMDPADDDW